MSEGRGLADAEVMALEMVPPVLADAGASVGDAIRLMQAEGSGYAIVTSGGSLVGIVTEGDIVHRVLGAGASLDASVVDVMSPEPVAVSERDSIRHACREMNRGDHRFVPVVDDQRRVVACVRHKDIGRYLVERFADHLLNVPPDPEQRARRAEGA